MFLRTRQSLPSGIEVTPSGHSPMRSADWNDMDTTDKNHFLGFCEKNVHRIDQAEISRIDDSLQKGQKVCLRFNHKFAPSFALVKKPFADAEN
jgi:hypothetical protein